jgi:4-carboxymuconolactone decarboxylase
VPDALFASAVERFGRATIVELAGVLGYYSMLAIAIRISGLSPSRSPDEAKSGAAKF